MLSLTVVEATFWHGRYKNRDFSASKLPLDLRPVFKLEVVQCGPVEKKEHSILLRLIRAVWRNSRTPFSK